MSGRAVEIRTAREAESALVSSVLVEAAVWAAERGAPIWPIEQLRADAIAADVAAGRFALALVDTEAMGTARLTREDPECWPDAVPGVAAYVHRIAVRRAWAGCGVTGSILDWCERRARELGAATFDLTAMPGDRSSASSMKGWDFGIIASEASVTTR